MKVNPHTFVPQSNVEYAALTVWKLVEPNNPNSFNFYLWAAHRGLTSTTFFTFASEIKDDPTIQYKGKIFTTKVMDYLKGRGLVK